MQSKPATLRLRRGHTKPLHAGHPWVFADAIDASGTDAEAEPGAEVRVVDAQGQVMGRGYYSPDSAIAVRLLTRNDEPADEQLLAQRIDAALVLRHDVLGLSDAEVSRRPPPSSITTAYRLIHSEGDGLGGLIVDRYGPYLCVQLGTVGMDKRRELIFDMLEKRLKPEGILDKSDKRIRVLEKLAPPQTEPFRGKMPDGPIEIQESGLRMSVDLRPGKGQKTGLYLDQRDNRHRFAEFAAGRDVLDVFAYTGGFSLYAARAGAKSLTLIEANEGALKAAQENLARNGVADADLLCTEWSEGFRVLREKELAYDLVVLDPPKFTARRDALQQALSGYRDLNAQVARLLRPGALLFTCSCSGSVTETDFERAVAAGITHAGRRATLLERRGPSLDHPTPPGFDQGRYLKCLMLRVE
jgi:23S rRNA (cytosine1962-C5)-methyltransferase